MKVWDLHCDTLSEIRYGELGEKPVKSFAQNDLQIDLEKLKKGDYMLQSMACFVNLGRKESPLQAVLEEIDIFDRILQQYAYNVSPVYTAADIDKNIADKKLSLMLTVEEGGCCQGSLGALRCLYRLGVRMMTLTWNYKNELACPNNVPGDAANVWPCSADTSGGLTERGREFIAEMERLRMILDVSHLSDAGILEVLQLANRPFVASHSNARALCGHVRNLTDEMIVGMANKGCITGLNYCASFLDNNPDRSNLKSRVEMMARQAAYLVDKGGEDFVALGSDFDGIEGDLELRCASDMPLLEAELRRQGFKEDMIERIFWRNAYNFYKANL